MAAATPTPPSKTAAWIRNGIVLVAMTLLFFCGYRACAPDTEVSTPEVAVVPPPPEPAPAIPVAPPPDPMAMPDAEVDPLAVAGGVGEVAPDGFIAPEDGGMPDVESGSVSPGLAAATVAAGAAAAAAASGGGAAPVGAGAATTASAGGAGGGSSGAPIAAAAAAGGLAAAAAAGAGGAAAGAAASPAAAAAQGALPAVSAGPPGSAGAQSLAADAGPAPAPGPAYLPIGPATAQFPVPLDDVGTGSLAVNFQARPGLAQRDNSLSVINPCDAAGTCAFDIPSAGPLGFTVVGGAWPPPTR